DVQICMMNARCIALIAQSRENWAPAGDNLFLDLDLTPENLPVGQRLKVGSAVIEITAEPHLGCGSFARRYGAEAVSFVNDDRGRSLRLRGVYARVIVNGVVSVGDEVSKVS
ncbi:MAG: MOSC domain-containing protein, partial [Pseudomonadota bacterium]